jgi:predicted MPP superfamily phosphohydrolase
VEDWRKLLQQAAGQGADVLAVTGDLFDDERMNEEAVQVLDSFVPSFPDGIYYIFGNHEHFRGVGQIKNYLAGTRINVLENAARQVPGKNLWFAGVDYPMRRDRFEADRQKMHRQAMVEVPEGVTAVLLAHHPECIDDGAESGVALTLTGHTHGGQFGIFGLPILPFFRYNRGLIKIGDSYGYVHSGNGSWFPCRIGCPPEIVTFTLKAK